MYILLQSWYNKLVRNCIYMLPTTTDTTEEQARVEQTSNGVIVRAPNGHFLPGTKPNNIITPETARDMHQLYRERHRATAAKWLHTEVSAISPDVITQEDAWGYLQAKEAVKILDSPHPTPDALRQIGQAIGALPTIADRAADQQSSTSTRIDIPQETMVAIARALEQQRRDADNSVVDATPRQTAAE
jgi:hypothetical protein